MRGSPIRTPSDQRSVGSSPRLIAASHVLHRLLMPRHPPCALNNLTNTQKQTLDKNRPEHHQGIRAGKDARVHCAVLNQQTATTPPGPTRPGPPTRGRRCETRDGPARRSPRNRNRFRVPLPQDPTACLRNPTRVSRRSTHPGGCSTSRPATAGSSELVSVPPSSTTPTTRGHPQPGGHHALGAALDHQTASGGQCSLERR